MGSLEAFYFEPLQTQMGFALRVSVQQSRLVLGVFSKKRACFLASRTKIFPLLD